MMLSYTITCSVVPRKHLCFFGFSFSQSVRWSDKIKFTYNLRVKNRGKPPSHTQYSRPCVPAKKEGKDASYMCSIPDAFAFSDGV